MQIVFDNQETINFEFIESPVTDYFRWAYKHLQHVAPYFDKSNLPYYIGDCFSDLVSCAAQLNIEVDRSRLVDQNYLNELHEIFEKKTDGSYNWLSYNAYIHLCEKSNNSQGNNGVYNIDWGDKSSPLVKKFDYQYTSSFVNKVCTGQIFFEWSELGKTPYDYWQNREPDNLQRMCELAKPTLCIRPRISIACKNIDKLEKIDKGQFSNWWNNFHDQWCNHWGISEWTVEQIHGVIPYAQTHETAKLQYLAENNHCPTKIKI